MKNKSYLFDGPKTPLIYSTAGVNLDYVKHKESEMDADLTADELEAAYFDGGPVICLEKSITVTGAAQTLKYNAPRASDAVIARLPRLIAVEVAIQLNALSVPKTDFAFTLSYQNAYGTDLIAMEQSITGNASIENGNSRQYIRFVPFVRYAALNGDGVLSLEDGKDPIFPDFGQLAAADITASGISAANLNLSEIKGRQIIGSVTLSIPVNSMTTGAIVTLTPVTSGRKAIISEMITTLDKVGAMNSKPADSADSSAKMG